LWEVEREGAGTRWTVNSLYLFMVSWYIVHVIYIIDMGGCWMV
jgi:hypothetical protein